MYSIKTTANFEAAHRLSKYKGKCKQLHGHNWKIELEAKSNTLNEQEMVFDFTKLKKILKEFDHKVILSKTPENQKIAMSIPKAWIKWVNFEPTAEELARYFAELIFKQEKLSEVTIHVWESEKNYAKFTKTKS